MSDINRVQQASGSGSAGAKRRGRGSQQRKQDLYRTQKNKDALAQIHAAAAERTFAYLDVDAVLAQLRSISISSTPTESQVPATVRGPGIISEIIFEEAQALIPRVIDAVQIQPIQMYRVTLSQVAVQQHYAYIEHSCMQDDVVIAHQHEVVTSDFIQEVQSTTKTFALLATVPNSFGKYDENGQEYRTFIPPHPIHTVEVPIPCEVTDGPTPAVQRALIQRIDVLNPNPFFVTIQTLNDVVHALAGDLVPPETRAYFRRHNPIPQVLWDDQDRILNPDELCVENYPQSDMFRHDLDTFRRFISASYSKMGRHHGTVHLNGRANTAMFMSLTADGDVNNPPRNILVRTARRLPEQQLLLGAIPLIGEVPPGPPISGFGLREPSNSCMKLDVNWMAMNRQFLAQK